MCYLLLFIIALFACRYFASSFYGRFYNRRMHSVSESEPMSDKSLLMAHEPEAMSDGRYLSKGMDRRPIFQWLPSP